MIQRNQLKYFQIIVLSGLIIWITAGYFSAKYLVMANKVYFSDISQLDEKVVESLSFRTDDNVLISAWYIDNNSDKAVVLLSGIGGNRFGQIERAKFFLKTGYSVLLPDLRETEKSVLQKAFTRALTEKVPEL
jgi:hypothetical protein